MNWLDVLIRWLFFVSSLGAIIPGAEVDSAPFIVTWQDGRSFEVNFHVKRTR